MSPQRRQGLQAVARDLEQQLGLPKGWGRVETDAVAEQRLAGRGARGLASGERVDIDPATDAAAADGRYLVAHELVHVAQMRLPAGEGPAPLREAELEADSLGKEYASTGRLRPATVALPGHAEAADTGSKAIFSERDLPVLSAKQAFTQLILNANSQFSQIEAALRAIPDSGTAAGAAVIGSTKARYIRAAQFFRFVLLNQVAPLAAADKLADAGLELSRVLFAAQVLGLFANVLSVAAYAQSSGASARSVALAIDSLHVFDEVLALAGSEGPSGLRAAMAVAPGLFQLVNQNLRKAIPTIQSNAETARKIMVAVQVASLAISIYQVWRAPIAAGGGVGGGIAGVTGGGVAIASANSGQIMQLVAAVRQLAAAGVLDATLVTAIGALGGGPQATPEPLQSSGVPPAGGGTPAPTAREQRLAQLAKDPDRATVDDQTRGEAKTMLELEEAGKVPGPVRRPVKAMGEHGDFVDGSGQKWDIKAPKNRAALQAIRQAKGQPAAPGQALPGEYTLQAQMNTIAKQLAKGRNVVIDVQGITATEVATLKNAVTAARLDQFVIYYP